MTYHSPPSAWVELAGRITAFLPGLPAQDAADIVAGMTPSARGRVRQHLAQHPDALVSGASDAPRSVQALITTLEENGIAAVRHPACLRCGRVRPLRRVVPGGRVCLGCEGVLAQRSNIGPCAVCGETRPRPSRQTCARCRRAQLAASRSCSACGKPAPMDPCGSCRPRPPAPCALCTAHAPVCARWPLGPVCLTCYRTSRTHPGTCPGCDRQRVLIARTGSRRVCGPCAGHADPYACPRCTDPRSYLVRGLCDRCTLHDELDRLFAPASSTGQYAHMHAALAGCAQPRTALNWIRHAHSARLLADLVATGRPLTHEDLDAMAAALGRGGAQTIDYLRNVLATYHVLPERSEAAARIERHLTRTARRHPEHAVLLRSYVRWSLLPRARRAEKRSSTSKTSRCRIRWAYTRINLAAAFLQTTNEQGIALTDVTQHDVDRWLAGNPSTRYEVRDFLVWTARRGHSRPLHVPHRPKADPIGLDEDSYWEILQQCLTDTALPLEVRAAGALLTLFGQHLTRIVALPVTALSTEDDHTVLVLDQTPLRLPGSLTDLLRELAHRPGPGWVANAPRRWLFPGPRPGQHLSAPTLARRLTAHHIHIRQTRTTALIELAQDLPPAILAPMLGLHPITAEQWRRRAATDWTAYLEVRQADRA